MRNPVVLLGVVVWLAACGASTSTAEPARLSSYDVDYLVEFQPAAGTAAVSITMEPAGGRVTRINFAMDPERYFDIKGDGEIVRQGDRLVWLPPGSGGALHYRYRIDHKRASGAYDARITADWAIVRGDDLVPPAVVRHTEDSDARTRLQFKLPEGWSVDTPYVLGQGGKYIVVSAGRSFDRPVGWLIAGKIGVRRDEIEGMQVSVAAPTGDGVRRNDMLAIITATGSAMAEAFGELPSKLLIVSAADPMWRGGLSAPRSLFVHADRPLISGNGTSTLMHELTHVITRIRGVEGEDWIAEGLAEYYASALLQRAGLISDSRFDKAIAWMRDHGRGIKRLHADRSAGERTARAVVLFDALDREIRKRTDGEKNLDDVTRQLVELRKVSLEDLREISERVIGAPATTLKQSPLLD